MAFQYHTYGPSCRLRPPPKVELGPESVPKLRAQFFHYARQPIDEPLSTTPYTAEPVVRPFSAYDNDRLEQAWQVFLKSTIEERVEKRRPETPDFSVSSHALQPTGSERTRLTTGLADLSETNDGSAFNTSAENSPTVEGNPLDGSETQNTQDLQHRSLQQPPSSFASTFPEGIPYTNSPTAANENGLRQSQVSDANFGDQKPSKDSEQGRGPRPRMPVRDSSVAGFPKRETVVGLSRLHAVEFPDMSLKPIYWTQVNDVAPIMRATWFYQASMEPVEATIANLLEKGYQYMKPWTETYKYEIASCLTVGPEAEARLVYSLVPDSDGSQGAVEGEDDYSIEVHKLSKRYKARGFLKKTPRLELLKQHKTFGVIYADGDFAQILRPNQLPSSSRGRKPLKDIVKHKEVGTMVIRGFDSRVWDKKHPLKNVYPPTLYRRKAPQSQSTGANLSARRNICHACDGEEEDPNVTDLVLVVHGIGQKLSERMESFAFTHAITSLRRDVTELMLSKEVSPVLRQSLGAIMCLPVNWRATLTEHPTEEVSEDAFFSLNDVTVPHMLETRAFINDVFVDIPYYMSNKHDYIVSAVAKEANRIYGQWRKNNPAFHQTGRVHIVGHSLGSVITMDILSQQPTKFVEPTNLTAEKALFNFDTKNVFFLGSPLGFFLHLHHKRLVPRQGRLREGFGKSASSDLGGEKGTFGCPAVDNVYNLVHPQDPVAYRLNPCVDVNYASNLKQAYIPTLDSGWMSGMFGRRVVPFVRPTTSRTDSAVRHSTRNLPSNVEMEVHDFTKEEIAEDKMYLLNDNGQIDWLLPLPGSFGIPYLNILYAHSSYWTSKDLVRFLVVEIGREPGRGEAIPMFKAKKRLER